MSKRKRKLAKQKLANKKYIKPKPIGNGYTDMSLLQEMINCSTCTNGYSNVKFETEKEEYDWMISNLPTLPYVKSQYLNFLFSNGLTTGDEEDDKRLNNFLYRLNIRGVTNYDVLQQAIVESKLYGRCGIRWLSEEDGIVLVHHTQYTIITDDDEEYKGFKKPLFYAVSTKEDKPIQFGSVNIDKEEFERTGRIVSDDGSWVIVQPNEFINLRNDTSVWEGRSILESDKQRLKLLASVYSRLNYDIEYDGPGRLLFYLRDDIINNGVNGISTGEIINQTSAMQEDRAEKARKEIEALAQEIKHSGSDSTILVSNIFKNLTHLPRVTKATEFFEWLMSKEGSIIAQNFSITPELIGLGDVSGNVSMEKIIDNGMINNIVPEREKIAIQFGPLLANHLGFEKVYFDKYELKQQLDKSAEIYKEMLSVAQCVAMATEEGDIMAKAIMNHALSTLGQKIQFDVESPLLRYNEEVREDRNENISERTDKAVKKVTEEVSVDKIR